MKHTVHIGDKPVSLEYADFDSVVNVDDLTRIDATQLLGESVTVSAVANRWGLMKNAADKVLASKKLEVKVFQSRFKARKRREASNNGNFFTILTGDHDSILDKPETVSIKVTEKALETCYETDPEWIQLQGEFIDAEKEANDIGSIYWALQDKCRKLNNLVGGMTPEDFLDQLLEGTINGIVISKR